MNFFVRNPNTHNNRNASDDSSRWAFEELKEQYEVKEFMGEGSFGRVHKVRSRRRNRGRKGLFNPKQNLYACKTIPKSKVDDIRMLKDECSNLEEARGHPHILNFEQTFEDDKEVNIISELLEGGDLYEAIINLSKQGAYFSEEDSAWMVRNILDGLSYLHDVVGIVHRDLKASNFMFKQKLEKSGKNKRSKANERNSKILRDIKIIDFGLSTKIDRETGKVTGCLGTPYYVAPEVLTEEPYDSKCDVWSIGVIAYLILSRRLPYQGKDEEETLRFLADAAHHQPKYDFNRWMLLDPKAVDFCKQLLQVDPSMRPTAREAMNHPWIVKHCGKAPPQRPRINLEHSIMSTLIDIEDPNMVPLSPTFDSERSNFTDDTQKIVLFDGLPDEEEERSGVKSMSAKKSLQFLFSPSRKQRSHSESSVSKKEGKAPRARQKTQNTLILDD
jgi:serine/threonine protein kinase